MDNPVVHFEILGSDGTKLIDFYRAVFGWPLQDNPLPGWPSYAIMEPARGIGGWEGRTPPPTALLSSTSKSMTSTRP